MQFEGTEEFIDRWSNIDIEKIDNERVHCISKSTPIDTEIFSENLVESVYFHVHCSVLRQNSPFQNIAT